MTDPIAIRCRKCWDETRTHISLLDNSYTECGVETVLQRDGWTQISLHHGYGTCPKCSETVKANKQ